MILFTIVIDSFFTSTIKCFGWCQSQRFGIDENFCDPENNKKTLLT